MGRCSSLRRGLRRKPPLVEGIARAPVNDRVYRVEALVIVDDRGPIPNRRDFVPAACPGALALS